MSDDKTAHWIERCRRLVKAMKMAQNVGCIDHLDCWDESEMYWYGPLEEAQKALDKASQ